MFKIKKREQIDEKFQWKISNLYPNTSAWEKDFNKLKKNLNSFSKFQGQLGSSPKILSQCLNKMVSLEKLYAKLYSYALTLHDQDARKNTGQTLYTNSSQLSTELNTILAFIQPEILSLPTTKLKKFMANKILFKYQHFLDNLIRLRKYVLSEKEEKIVAQSGYLSQAPEKAYETLATLNLPWPEVKLNTNKKIILTPAMYSKLRGSSNRQERLKIFTTFWNTYSNFRETFASLLSGAVNRDHYYAQVRGYKNDLEYALYSNNLSTAVYTTMISQVKIHLPLLWKYLRLHKKNLKVSSLGYHDLYAPSFSAFKPKYTYAKAYNLILAATAPLGQEYTQIMQKAFTSGWTDVFPNQDKRAGAYMLGAAYEVHPYILLNYTDDYESLTTTAHEFGHAAHSYLSNQNQAFIYANYPIFVAEVASIVNEQLLNLYLLDTCQNHKEKAYLLNKYLENWRLTVFRQTLFAEFELKIHTLAQNGQALTADLLDKTYLDLLHEYYGHKQGITIIDSKYASEWAYVPHFYYTFYMFQYTTSFIAATAIAQDIYAGKTKRQLGYWKMLKAGGSKYALDLLKLAGVDMSTTTPYKNAFKILEKTLSSNIIR